MHVIIIKNTILYLEAQNKLFIFIFILTQCGHLVIGIRLVEKSCFIHHTKYQNQWILCLEVHKRIFLVNTYSATYQFIWSLQNLITCDQSLLLRST